MTFELVWISAGLMIGAVSLFMILSSSVNDSYSQERLTNYFTTHPTRFEIIFHLMFISFPVVITLETILRMNASNAEGGWSIIALFAVFWPIFMYMIHWRFVYFAIKLGFSSRKRKEYEPSLKAKIKILGWIGSIAAVVFSLVIGQVESLMLLRNALATIGFLGIAFIPIRKPLSTIRSKGEPVVLNDQRSKVLILDLDGVIRHLDVETAERAAQSIGFTYTELMNTLWYNEHSYEILCGRSSREVWWDHVTKLDPRLEGVSQDVLWDEVFEITTYDNELIEYVRTLREKFITVILTNCDKESKIQILDELGNDHPFDFVLSSSDFGVAKPDPEIFEKLLARIGAKAEQCVFIDDAIANVEGAEAFGIRSFLYEGLDHFRSIIDAWNE